MECDQLLISFYHLPWDGSRAAEGTFNIKILRSGTSGDRLLILKAKKMPTRSCRHEIAIIKRQRTIQGVLISFYRLPWCGSGAVETRFDIKISRSGITWCNILISFRDHESYALLVLSLAPSVFMVLLIFGKAFRNSDSVKYTFRSYFSFVKKKFLIPFCFKV